MLGQSSERCPQHRLVTEEVRPQVAVELPNHAAMILTRGGHGHGIKADPRGFALG